MQAHKEQTPRQGLPDGGSAVPFGVSTTNGSEDPVLEEHLMTTKRVRKVPAKPDHTATIAHAMEAANEVVNDDALDELDWLVVLKEKLLGVDTPFRDSDLQRYLRQAKLNRDGRKDFISGDTALKIREQEWLWEGVIMREATNMIFALPKIGKTRLMLALLSSFLKGRGEFAGLPIRQGNERLLILGPDQSETSWGGYLQKAGLADAQGHLDQGIVAMTTAETFFQLDDYWLSRVEEKLREHGPLIVLLDSYSAAIRALGVDENRSESAVPLMKLHNLINQYSSTLIVIHHSNKAGGEGSAAQASRGSSAISAAADNLIQMSSFRGDGEEGAKKYELRVEGRAETDGVPLIGFSKHSDEWMSYGSVHEAKAELQKDENYDALTSAQLLVLNALVEATTQHNKGLSVSDLAQALHENPTKSQKVVVNKTINRLLELGFAVQKPCDAKGTRYKQNLFMATGWAVTKHQLIEE